MATPTDGNLKQKGAVEIQKYEFPSRKSQESSTSRPAIDEKKIKRRHSIDAGVSEWKRTDHQKGEFSGRAIIDADTVVT